MVSGIWLSTIVIVVALHVSALIVSIMALMMVHQHDRSETFKRALLGVSAITLTLGAIGAIFVFTGLFRGYMMDASKE